jgi:hypothetical protein
LALQQTPREQAMCLDGYSHVKKQHLPSKTCVTCHKPFNWRKKWEKVWDEVKYCSERCRRNRATP